MKDGGGVLPDGGWGVGMEGGAILPDGGWGGGWSTKQGEEENWRLKKCAYSFQAVFIA